MKAAGTVLRSRPQIPALSEPGDLASSLSGNLGLPLEDRLKGPFLRLQKPRSLSPKNETGRALARPDHFVMKSIRGNQPADEERNATFLRICLVPKFWDTSLTN